MNKLQEKREAKGFSRKELAGKVGITERTLRNYETGKVNINHSRGVTVLLLAKVLDCSVADLTDWDKIDLSRIKEHLEAEGRELPDYVK